MSAESGEFARLDEERVKLLTGGDRIKGRYMRQDFHEFTPSHTLMLMTNHKPEISGADNGIWRRIQLWPFDARFEGEREDKRLPERLAEELAGILAWCVLGRHNAAYSGVLTFFHLF